MLPSPDLEDQPTFFRHLALANDYKRILERTWQAWSKPDMMLYVVLRKTKDEPFLTPIQGMKWRESK